MTATFAGLVLPMLMQVGPAPRESVISALPEELANRPDRPTPTPMPTLDTGDADETTAQLPAALQDCLQLIRSNPAVARDRAERNLLGATGERRIIAAHCLGLARSELGQFTGARDAFLTARESVVDTDANYRAMLGLLAGNAALANGDAATALADFGPYAFGLPLAGDIALDSARALVALGRLDEAASALAFAREAKAGDAAPFLYSATLARRLDDLAAAQMHIEQAVTLDPLDPAIGLEAGVIAILQGREDAARKSWQSVLDTAPDGAEAEVAKGYLAQIAQPAPNP
ncbi:hypothetical protein HME9302_02480 [Alteripontixanthobacter maritimus]|uniref:Uncharacterized protein n=1 Tax=Alteripontixanthobacter maritimus TaxID=2161824 RepID=A0A369QEC5_9SPHN|nr:hypothetical protein [Alteripontixanthobacter maritimus]RDC61259.1 hypothetical protein HME9302_02480 [Alteripontixanthobacter maritimus]